MQRRLASGGQAEATPGAETAQRRSTSDSTVAHWTFLTSSGIMVLSSDLPSEWLSAHAQWMSLMAGCVSCAASGPSNRFHWLRGTTHKKKRVPHVLELHHPLKSLIWILSSLERLWNLKSIGELN